MTVAGGGRGRWAARPRVAAGAVVALVVVAGLVLAGFRSGSLRRPAAPAAAPAVAPAWREATVGAPRPGERFVLRDAVACAGRWFVVGAVVDASERTRPAAWSSRDGSAWVPVAVGAVTFYGRQNVLSSVACRQGRMAALGAKSGGAHGNPRVATWRESPEGRLVEVTAPFELFGGPQAVNVARIDGGPGGWLVSGNRIKGASVWVSPDAAGFSLVEGAPRLGSGAGLETWAFDAVGAADGWLVVGGEQVAGRIDRDPVGWSSPDGRVWARVPAPGTSAYEELQRVVLVDGVAVAAGLRGRAFGVWRREGSGWSPLGAFGAVAPGGASGVRSLTTFGGRLFCVTTDGADHALWVSGDAGVSWRQVAAPVPVPARAEQVVAAAGAGARLMLVVDDGTGGRMYSAETGW